MASKNLSSLYFAFLVLCASFANGLLDVKEDSLAIQQWLTEVRRSLHQIPELGFEEIETSKFIRDKLDGIGISYEYPVGFTGLVARLGSGKPKVALRADIDALPIQEEIAVLFKSQNDGRMHACGHDAHIAMLLGAARVLKEREKEVVGTVLLIFQPAEEGKGGAKHVVDYLQKELKDIRAVHGIHVWPELPSGTIASKSGTIMSASTFFDVVIAGSGGHAGSPHLTKDPVIAAAAIVHALQPLVSRETDPLDGAVISVTKLSAGEGANNVIPGNVLLGGSLRAVSSEQFQHLIQRADEVITRAAAMHGCKAMIKWREVPYIPTVNDARLVGIVERLAHKLVGQQRWKHLERPSMAAEDFGFLAEVAPGAFTLLGIRNESAGAVHGLHTSRFTMDDSVLHIGTALHVAFALEIAGRRVQEQEL